MRAWDQLLLVLEAPLIWLGKQVHCKEWRQPNAEATIKWGWKSMGGREDRVFWELALTHGPSWVNA